MFSRVAFGSSPQSIGQGCDRFEYARHLEGAYTDDYRRALLQLIHKKIELGGRTPARGKAPSQPAATKVIDLLSVLQESLAKAGKSAGVKNARGRKPKRLLKKAA